MIAAKICSKCKEVKAITEFHKESSRKDRLSFLCKLCKAAKNKTYQMNYKEELKVYRTIHKLQIMKIKKVYQRNRRLTNPFFHICCKLRHQVNRVKSKFGIKSKTAQLLGCTFEFAQAHLIQTAILNYGSYSKATIYHVDHILPLSSATTEAEAISLSHYTNLQYLTAQDNMAKGSKLDWSKLVCLDKPS